MTPGEDYPSNRLVLQRITDISTVPKEFFLDSMDPLMTEENVDKLHERAHLLDNPFTYLYTFHDRDDLETPVGVIWIQHDPLFDHVIAPFFAVAKEYRDSLIRRKITQFIEQKGRELGCKLAFGSMTKPRIAASVGWKIFPSHTIYKEVDYG